jgi:hypothetical protein
VREAAIPIKFFLFNVLALVCFRNTCPSVSYFQAKGRFGVGLADVFLEDLRRSERIDRRAFCDSAQIYVFVRPMSNGK